MGKKQKKERRPALTNARLEVARRAVENLEVDGVLSNEEHKSLRAAIFVFTRGDFNTRKDKVSGFVKHLLMHAEVRGRLVQTKSVAHFQRLLKREFECFAADVLTHRQERKLRKAIDDVIQSRPSLEACGQGNRSVQRAGVNAPSHEPPWPDTVWKTKNRTFDHDQLELAVLKCVWMSEAWRSDVRAKLRERYFGCQVQHLIGSASGPGYDHSASGPSDEHFGDRPDQHDPPNELVLRETVARHLAERLYRSLHDRSDRIVFLGLLAEDTNAEIGAILGRAQATISERKKRVRERTRREMEESAVANTDEEWKLALNILGVAFMLRKPPKSVKAVSEEDVVRALQNPDAVERSYAVMVLAHRAANSEFDPLDDERVSALLEALGRELPGLRRYVARKLALASVAQFSAGVLGLLESDEDPSVRKEAAESLASLHERGDARQRSRIESGLQAACSKDDDPDVKKQARASYKKCCARRGRSQK